MLEVILERILRNTRDLESQKKVTVHALGEGWVLLTLKEKRVLVARQSLGSYRLI